ncbi:MAG: hypothetical protein KVP17_000709 [Porospora cf. gigantea B]|uniref:uncharacterized protein n=1 Tax=Porospora cf. gigantea B TaxID=2853592 RepID=UPI003571B32A|nr:MAG: hypothetical protein KVP17_000709 [Porospora cf. gigantea B]
MLDFRRAVTRFAGVLARKPCGFLTTVSIRVFSRVYGVNMEEAAESDFGSYKTFQDFFCRDLKPGARPLSDVDLVCPVDGSCSQTGIMDGDLLVQAKTQRFRLDDLLGGDSDELTAVLNCGTFATLYLHPRAYHRVHMPCAGHLESMIYVPGKFYSVRPSKVEKVSNLFAENERVVCVFRSDCGFKFCIVLVGATIVGSVETTWAGVLSPAGSIVKTTYEPGEVYLEKGHEAARFRMGSTVILVFETGSVALSPALLPGASVLLNSPLGSFCRAVA